jgi:hypothetical protein
MKHSDAVNRIRLAVSEMGGLSVPYTVGMFRTLEDERRIKIGREGVSDVLACIGGRFVAVEVKVNRDVWRDEQRDFAQAVKAAGGRYVLVRFDERTDGVETLKRALAA